MITILGSSGVVPETVKYSTDIDKEFHLKTGETERKTGIYKRYFASGLKASELGKQALDKALEEAQLQFTDIDALIVASGTPQQIIPCNASLLLETYKSYQHTIPCFDVNSTCMSFLSALEVVEALLATKKYTKIAVVSSEAGDGALNPHKFETYSIIGNAASAYIFTSEKREHKRTFSIVDSRIQTYPDYTHVAEIRAGGSANYLVESTNKEDYYFDMQGLTLMKAVHKHIFKLLDEQSKRTGLGMKDIAYVVPHQASGPGLEFIRKALRIETDQCINILRDYGNCISASIPFALDVLLKTRDIKPNSYTMLLGTGAGMSIGSVILKWETE